MVSPCQPLNASIPCLASLLRPSLPALLTTLLTGPPIIIIITPAGQYCVDCIADACLAARRDFDPRALAHVLWNMSRLGYVDELFYQAFVPGGETGRHAAGPGQAMLLVRAKP